MTSKDFDLDFDRQTGTLTFRPRGHWTRETVDRWEVAIGGFLERHARVGSEAIRLVVDLSDREPHSKDIATRVQDGVARFAPAFERVAIVLPRSTIMNLQARRIASTSSALPGHQRQFASDDLAGAFRWASTGTL